MSDTHVQCDFCGKARNEVDKLIVANDAGICNECIEFCASILNKERTASIVKDKKISKALDPVKIKQFLDLHVIGQDSAKMALSVAVVNHYKRVFFNPDIELEKSNLLFYGPTGSGKTLLAKTVAKYLDVPFVVADATTLTQAGYVGEDVDSMILRLLSMADMDIDRCQRGIVFIDEIDKIGRKNESATTTRDVSGEGVQQALLKLVEGTVCNLNIGNGKKSMSDHVEIDTSNILFIAGGSFDGLQTIVNKRVNQSSMGFTTGPKEDVNMADVLPDDFIKFGLIPEFIGRFPIAVHVDQLDLADLTRILIEPQNSLIRQMQFYFEADNIELEFDDTAILAVAQQALDQKIGARGLKSILEQSLMSTMYSLGAYKRQGISKIRVTQEVITQHKEPEFIKL